MQEAHTIRFQRYSMTPEPAARISSDGRKCGPSCHAPPSILSPDSYQKAVIRWNYKIKVN